MNKFLLVISIVVCLVSCTKYNSKGYAGSGNNNDFPNGIGSWWVYDVADSNSTGSVSHHDVTVNITGTRNTALGIAAAVWEYHYPNYTDTNFVIANADSVNIFFNSIPLNDAQLMINPSLKLYQPFSKWLSSKSSIIEPFLTLHNDTTFNTPYLGQLYTYHTWHYYPGVYTPSYYDFWYKDGIGLVKKQFSHWDPMSNVTSYNIWDLRSYQLK